MTRTSTPTEAFTAMRSSVASAKPDHVPAAQAALPCQLRHWIEIELYDDDGHPVARQAYEIRRSSGSPLRAGATVVTGHLDGQGYAQELHLEGVEECVVTFPGLESSDEIEPMPDEFWTTLEAD